MGTLRGMVLSGKARHRRLPLRDAIDGNVSRRHVHRSESRSMCLGLVGGGRGPTAAGRVASGGDGHAPSLMTVVVTQRCALVKMDGFVHLKLVIFIRKLFLIELIKKKTLKNTSFIFSNINLILYLQLTSHHRVLHFTLPMALGIKFKSALRSSFLHLRHSA